MKIIFPLLFLFTSCTAPTPEEVIDLGPRFLWTITTAPDLESEEEGALLADDFTNRASTQSASSSSSAEDNPVKSLATIDSSRAVKWVTYKEAINRSNHGKPVIAFITTDGCATCIKTKRFLKSTEMAEGTKHLVFFEDRGRAKSWNVPSYPALVEVRPGWKIGERVLHPSSDGGLKILIRRWNKRWSRQ